MKTQVQFDTYPVNTALDPSGGYAMKLKDLQIVNDDSVFEEVVKEKTLPISADLLEFSFLEVLKTMSLKASKDCRPRKIGSYLKCTPYLRGKLKTAYSAYDPDTCSCAIVFTSLSGLDKTVDTDKYIRFVNSKTGTKVTIDRITYEGSTVAVGVIMKGKGVIVTGLNCQFLTGDTCTLIWQDASGTPHTASITPTSSSVTEMRFAWPTALNDVEAGTEVTFRFLTRGGIEESEPQQNDKTVTVLDNPDPTPSLTKIKEGTRTDNLVGFTTSAVVLSGTIPGGFKTSDALKLEGAPTTPTGTDYQANILLTNKVTASTETSITLGNGFSNTSELPDGDWNGKCARVMLVRDGQDYALTFNFETA